MLKKQRKRRVLTLEHRLGISRGNKGKKRKPHNLTPEHRLAISRGLKGKKKSPIAIEKLSKRMLGNKIGLGRKHTLETRRKISEAHKGERSYMWKGGITSINEQIRRSLEYKLWRESVFERDNYTCVWCGARGGQGKRVDLHADHVKSFAYYPELRFAIDNGRTLCVPCHKTTDNYGGRNINQIPQIEL